MTSIKIKFHPSTDNKQEGRIYYQVIHNRTVRQLKTSYHLHTYEWNEKKGTVTTAHSTRQNYLLSIATRIECDTYHLRSIIKKYERLQTSFTINDIVSAYHSLAHKQSLFNYMYGIIARLQLLGKQRTSETYRSTLRSFMQFRDGNDIQFNEIDTLLIQHYETYLLSRGITRNSTSFYMRILRAVYNRAVEEEFTTNRTPFRHVYTGCDKTIKRAISLKEIKRIKDLDLSLHPTLDYARDIFLFSFYTRGMSFVDMAHLRKKDLTYGILSYCRRKTGRRLTIRWEKCMNEIVKKYDNPLSEYLLPIIKPGNRDTHSQYQNALYQINRHLKQIGKMANITIPLSTYVARHSWASIAKSKNIPISVISEGMGHDSEMTTQIYLASLDATIVDNANHLILKDL